MGTSYNSDHFDEYIDLISVDSDDNQTPRIRKRNDWQSYQAYLSKSNLCFLIIYEFILNTKICINYIKSSYFNGETEPCLKTLKNMLIDVNKTTENDYMSYIKGNCNENVLKKLLEIIDVVETVNVSFFNLILK